VKDLVPIWRANWRRVTCNAEGQEQVVIAPTKPLTFSPAARID
jgi:hypothetical protein